MSFAKADALHTTAASAIATREPVAGRSVERLSFLLRQLAGCLGEAAEDEIWSFFIRRCRRIVREMCLTPLPPVDPVFALGPAVGFLKGLMSSIAAGYSSEALALATSCVAAIDLLAVDFANPIGERVVEVLEMCDPETALVVVKSPHRTSIQRWLTAVQRGFIVCSERELVVLDPVETLVVVGPSSWYPPHVLSAPRAESLCFVTFEWMRDTPTTGIVLAGAAGFRPIAVREPRVHSFVPCEPQNGGSDNELVTSLFPSDEFALSVDWSALERSLHRPEVERVGEMVDATLFLLAGGNGVYLEAVEGAKIDAIDCDGTVIDCVETRFTSHIRPGDFVVLRTVGGSADYVADLADINLGSRAADLRSLQKLWKAALRTKVMQSNHSCVEADLQRLGIKNPNLRYRLLRQSIRAQRPEDFRILMKYLELGARANELWAAMGQIHHAHASAGKRARSLLEKAVTAADPAALMSTGVLEVELAGLDAGKLGVFRVDGRAPVKKAVPESDLRRLRRVDRDLWQS